MKSKKIQQLVSSIQSLDENRFGFKGAEIGHRIGKLLETKRSAYGTFAIDQTGVYGIATRLLDKVARLQTLSSKEKRAENDESLKDTIYDGIGYFLLALDELEKGNLKGEFYKSDKRVKIIEKIKDGEEILYYPSGELLAKGNYVNGKEEGEWISYFENGEIFTKGFYKNGKRQGLWIWYYDNGKIRMEETYKDGLEIKQEKIK